MNIKLENITFYYNQKLPGVKPVLKDLNFEMNGNEFIGIIGPSGSGKTTLVQLFTGLLQPTVGQVFIDGADLSNNDINLDQIRKKIGLVFQFPETQLFEETVYNDIAFGPKNFGFTDSQIEDRVTETFNLIGMDLDTMKNRSPFKLSEGEKRRVALAGILSMDPDVLILDEPTACLDPKGIYKIEQLLTTLHASGKAVVLVSHNLDFIAKLCERIVVLHEGRINFDGKKDVLFDDENILKMLDIELPRIVRYSKKLQKLGYITKNHIFSISDLTKALGE